MQGSSISTFGESDEFLATLKEAGYRELIVTQRGPFRAHLTRIVLRHMRLSSVEEGPGRIAILQLPKDAIRIVMPVERGRIMCGGITAGSEQLITHGADSIHERVEGSCRWRDIVVSAPHLGKYHQALRAQPLLVPPGARLWHPTQAALKNLLTLHAASMRVTEAKSEESYSREAEHGLEQELINQLVKCLSVGPQPGQTSAERDGRIIDQLDHSIESQPDQMPRLAEICHTFGIAERTLRRSCQMHLGMSPAQYVRLRRMQLVHRALRCATPGMMTVTQVLREFGFHEAGRFATAYKKRFGEPPSATLYQ